MPEVIGCGVNSVNSSHRGIGRQEKTGKDRPGQIGPVKTRYDTAKNKLKPICPGSQSGHSSMNSTIYSQIGLRVRQLRRQQHRSQDELSVWLRAFHAPITRDMIANWETGRAVVPAVYIPVLAYALKVEVTDILPSLTLKDLKAGHIMPVFRRPRGRPPTHL